MPLIHCIDPTSSVIERPDNSRFEISSGCKVVGFTAFHRSQDTIAFLHTEVGTKFQGRGFADKLIGGALRIAEEEDLEVLPVCPYVRAHIARHPAHVGLVPAE